MPEERRLAAIMFVDICGFSRIMGQDETQALEIVDMASSVIEQAAEVYTGRIIKKLGDGILAEFPSAVNAVQGALEVQRAVARHNDRAPEEEKFLLRIGIHVGDVVVADGDILGDGVNVASRIEPLAEPGGICISRDVLDLVHSKIAIETVNLGPQDLKNISRRIDIYSVLIDAMGAGPPGGRRRPPMGTGKRIGIAAAALILLAALAIGARVLKEVRFQKEARSAFERIEHGTRQAAEAGRLEEALELLHSYPEAFRETPWQEEIDKGIAMVQEELDRRDLHDRQVAFLTAVQNDDRTVALSLLDPEILRHVDATAMWLRLRFAAVMLKLVKIDAGSFQVKDIDFSNDRNSAHVRMQLFRKTTKHPEGIWQDLPEWEWRRINNEWLAHVQPPEPPEEATSSQKPPGSDFRKKKPPFGRRPPRGRPPQ